MAYQILLLIIISSGFILGLVPKPKFGKLIFWSQIIALGLSIIPINSARAIGDVLFILTLVLMIIFSLGELSFIKKKKALISLIILPLLIRQIFFFQHYPYVRFMNLMLIVSVGIWGYIIVKERKDYENELGVLNIIASMALLEMINFYY